MVIDTSIVIKWIKHSKEEGVSEALEYYQKFQNNEITLAVPDIIFYEISNFASRQTEETSLACQELINFLLESGTEIIPPNKESLAETIALAHTLNISAYDAAYLTTARNSKTKLLTADQKLIQVAPDLTISL